MKLLKIIIVISFCAIIFLPASTFAQKKQYKFFDGEDWTYIDRLEIPGETKVKIKALVLRPMYETTFLMGSPAVETSGPIIDFLPDLDKFYEHKENKPLPLLFALKIIEAQRRGASIPTTQKLRSSMIIKLVNAGVIDPARIKKLYGEKTTEPPQEKPGKEESEEKKGFFGLFNR